MKVFDVGIQKNWMKNCLERNFALDRENSKRNTQFSQLFFSETNPAIFLIFCVSLTLDLNSHLPALLFVVEFFLRDYPRTPKKVGFFSYFLSTSILTLGKKFYNKQQSWWMLVQIKCKWHKKNQENRRIRFREKQLRKSCVSFWIFAIKCEVSLQTIFRSIFLNLHIKDFYATNF